MIDNIIVVPGSGRVDIPALKAVAGDFGWVVDVADDLYELAAVQTHRKTVAVLFSRDALGAGYSWLETISLLRFAVPEARLVACHGFSESIDWPELCDAGAFHSLWLPLKEDEVRKSFGFIWEAENRLTGFAESLPDIVAVRGVRAVQRMASGRSGGLRACSRTRAVG